MRGEEATAMPPKHGPEHLSIRSGHGDPAEPFGPKEGEAAFMDWRRQGIQQPPDLEEEHEPVSFALVAMLANQAGEMELARLNLNAQFFLGLPTSTSIRRLAKVRSQFASRGAPKTKIGVLGAFQ